MPNRLTFDVYFQNSKQMSLKNKKSHIEDLKKKMKGFESADME